MSISYDTMSLIQYILFGEFGLLTTVPSFLFKILFPIITSFYLLQAFLIESNFLDMLSSRLDKPLGKIGLSSNSILSFFLGFGCITVALGSLQLVKLQKRERRIAEALLCITIPCSAQLVINTILVFKVSPHYLLVYILMILFLSLLIGWLLNFLFMPGKQAERSFHKRVRLQFPNTFLLIKNSFLLGVRFLKETAIPFAIGNVIISVLSFFGFIKALCQLTSPLICNFLHLPEEAATIFILSIIKKDLGAASLLAIFENGVFTPAQIFTCIVMLTLFVPCLASMIVLFKYEKFLFSMNIWFSSLILSILVGKGLSLLLMLP
ncbi:nucleoside recognition domain-containing protein [Clostridium aminobutyricum]|uniref:Nucleoside transporter/FeoB GTPase Gate domain-containing protein n=1 Tax=Clostridium aminobutyricum TaxID=33953 RepID=A0A939IG69_CLOAM|nr:nucleoside recognition domain-containing protein [Clostridium aminobutyricum]MBN7772735.1 hypothetical protein [Clostridium aminobutyricum]